MAAGSQAGEVPAWIVPGRAYPGWAWVVALAALWWLFASLLAVIGELQRGMELGRLTEVSLGYYGTALAAALVGVCAFVRRRWARLLLLVTSVPMLMLVPVGTLVAAMAIRALLKARGWFDASRS